MSSTDVPWQERSTVTVVPPARPRALAKVPFVELAGGRLQGVVSSGSDIERVYVSSISARGHGYHCSTNNNRPCGGLRGSYCNHVRAMVREAVLQYGVERVARYLHIEIDETHTDGDDLLALAVGEHEPAAAATVFSRFLRHLTYLELPVTTRPLPEMHWFPASGAAR